MESEELEFSTVKEHRDWYFVEYRPFIDTWLSTLDVVVIDAAEEERVADAMESEARRWFTRYPSPLMVSAFNDVGDLVSLENVRECDHLMAHAAVGSDELRLDWRIVPDGEVHGKLLTDDERLRVYADVPHAHTSSAERDLQFKAFARNVRTGRRLATLWLVVWLAVIPASWALVQWSGPKWLGLLVLVYSLVKAAQQLLRLLDVWKPGRRERESEEKRMRMEEYYEECERNPEGFQRLKSENFEREVREQILTEARDLETAGTTAMTGSGSARPEGPSPRK